MDTLVYGLGHLVGGFPAMLSAIGMFFAQLAFNFVVPSGSGQALVTMPIMAPLSDLIGVTRQTAVLAYQLGDGLGKASSTCWARAEDWASLPAHRGAAGYAAALMPQTSCHASKARARLAR